MYFKADKEKVVELHGYNGLLSRREELVGLIEVCSDKDRVPESTQYICRCSTFDTFFVEGSFGSIFQIFKKCSKNSLISTGDGMNCTSERICSNNSQNTCSYITNIL